MMTKQVLPAIAIALCTMAAAAPTPRESGEDAKNPAADFFRNLDAQQDALAEYRFLTSPAVRQDKAVRSMAGQLLATHLSLLGRPQDALRAHPFRRADEPRDDLPSPAGYTPTPATDWIAAQAGAYRAILVNEAHHAPQTRVLTLSLLQALRDRGYRYLAVEALANDGKDPLPGGYPVRTTGVYTREPVFAEMLREARRLGYALVPYEPQAAGEQSQQRRETGQARAIADLLAKDPQAKVLVHAGYAHIGEAAEGLPDGARPMAMELTRMSGLPLLTVDQTSTRSYEAGDADTIGKWLTNRFAIREPSVLVERGTENVWSYKPGLYDVSVLLPASPPSALRPDWLELGAKRRKVAVDMTACLERLPCLIEARHAGEGDDAIPADQFLALERDEAGTPLFLAPGRYRLRLRGGDGAALAERELSVPAGPFDSLPAAPTP